eukprot:TRINITY_DN3456_c0_g1_i1.p1 TRINITY_DN3456_c0_g1~~TRINITY_DN3456_c0_g1_i1.p1  ORF type:complete len:720 (+),score=70.87 TRINITY_DN3456_c0_g1_i1:43-2160(+)
MEGPKVGLFDDDSDGAESASLPDVREEEPAYVAKVAVLGDSGVGKTTFFSKYGSDSDEHLTGVSFLEKTVDVQPLGNVTIQLWDTHDTRFDATYLYQDLAGLYLMYAAGNHESVRGLQNAFAKYLQLWCADKEMPPVVILRNELDSQTVDDANVKTALDEFTNEFFKTATPPYIEISATTGKNLDQCDQLMNRIYLPYIAVFGAGKNARVYDKQYKQFFNILDKVTDIGELDRNPKDIRKCVVVFIHLHPESLDGVATAVMSDFAKISKSSWFTAGKKIINYMITVLQDVDESVQNELARALQHHLQLKCNDTDSDCCVYINNRGDRISLAALTAVQGVYNYVEKPAMMIERQPRTSDAYKAMAGSSDTAEVNFKHCNAGREVTILYDKGSPRLSVDAARAFIKTLLGNTPEEVIVFADGGPTLVDTYGVGSIMTYATRRPPQKGYCEVWNGEGVYAAALINGGGALKAAGKEVSVNCRLRIPGFLVYPVGHHVGKGFSCGGLPNDITWEEWLTTERRSAIGASYFTEAVSVAFSDVWSVWDGVSGSLSVVGKVGSGRRLLMEWLDGTPGGPDGSNPGDKKYLKGRISSHLTVHSWALAGDVSPPAIPDHHRGVIFILPYTSSPEHDATSQSELHLWASICIPRKIPLLILLNSFRGAPPDTLIKELEASHNRPSGVKVVPCSIPSGNGLLEGLRWLRGTIETSQ